MNMPKASGTGEQSMWNESYPPMDLTVSSIPVIPVEDEGGGLHPYPHSCRDYHYVFAFMNVWQGTVSYHVLLQDNMESRYDVFVPIVSTFWPV